ncbi:Chitin synthase, class 2 [Rhizophlyctis rosea]|uniref:Chitin synthase n=1 Tax=Rhizophlyctis rosea TaxID=64517 RepID=A0AAD5SBC4_9FUNG|nr:Chitin synthase, class 2 [Rhizophlyctis rosea]
MSHTGRYGPPSPPGSQSGYYGKLQSVRVQLGRIGVQKAPQCKLMDWKMLRIGHGCVQIGRPSPTPPPPQMHQHPVPPQRFPPGPGSHVGYGGQSPSPHPMGGRPGPPPHPHHPLQGHPPQHPIDIDIQHYRGPPMADQMLARKRTVRNIPLTPQGNLVIDVPVPDRVLGMGKLQNGEEFTHMRYTAATCTADEFSSRGYSLRQQEYGRQTELFIVVTMYNEDDFLFCKSMSAIMKNIAHLCTRTRSRTWGAEGWKKVVVCIVSDGRSKVNPRVLNVLGLMGAFQDGIMKDHVNAKPVTAHLFEYTTQLCVDEELKVKGHEKGFVPVQILFCLKEKNAKKINSHRWFFNAFGPLLRPNVCILIDVGTKPQPTALYHLWKAFDRSPSVGGACGEIYAELGTGCSNLLNPLVAAQNFEYKMSNILDKPLESVFGFISVLPGAFSAYRYVALQGKPLAQYFKGETMHGGADIFAANMYLAEDRILCFELMSKRNQGWTLKYVKAAKAETDVPDSVPEFISQRRRWLNGSFFAGVHALTHWYWIFRSGQNFIRKFALLFLFLYNFIQLLFSWFGLAFFYLTFVFLLRMDVTDDLDVPLPDKFFGKQEIVYTVLRQMYVMAIIMTFISSLGNRPQGSKWMYTVIMVLFAAIMATMTYVCGYNIYLLVPKTSREWKGIMDIIRTKPALRDVVLSLFSTYGLYILSSVMYLEPWHMITSFIQYMFLMPSFINILNVYAFCNLHDVSWGTKGDNDANATDLGAVTAQKGKDGKQMVEIDIPSERNDINANYEKFLSGLAQPRPDSHKSRDSKTKQEDYFRNFRTKVVCLWAFSNALIIIVLTDEKMSGILFNGLGVRQNGGFNPYLQVCVRVAVCDSEQDFIANNGSFHFQFIFYSVLGLSTFRFIGCTVYLIMNMICG